MYCFKFKVFPPFSVWISFIIHQYLWFQKCLILIFLVVQLVSCVRLFSTPWTAARQASQSFTISQSLLTLMSVESVMPSNHLILCHPLFLPSIFPSIGVFSKEAALCIRWAKYWTFKTTYSVTTPCQANVWNFITPNSGWPQEPLTPILKTT